MKIPIGKPVPTTPIHMKFSAHTKVPWAHWGSGFKPSLIAGTVRVSRRMLLGIVGELLEHIPEDKYDISPVLEALELAQKDTVMEVGLPEDRTSVTTNVTKPSAVPAEGGVWVTFSLGPVKENK